MKKRKSGLRFPFARPIDVALVLGRLNEIVWKDQVSTCSLYQDGVGIMVQFRATVRILSEGQLTSLMQLSDLVGGRLVIGPVHEDLKDPETGIPYRAVEIDIRTGPVELLPKF